MGNIPKNFLQTCKTKDIPDKWKSSPGSVRRYLPDWNYVLTDDVDNRKLVETHFPDFLETYDSFPRGIQRADAVRYIWLYLYGGVYMDLDSELQKSIEPLFEETQGDLYLVKAPNGFGYYTNMFMASSPKNPFWLECISEMKQSKAPWWMPEDFQVLWTTGPGMVTRVAERWDKPIVSIPSKLIVPNNVCCPGVEHPDAYAKQLEGGSCNGPIIQTGIYLQCHWQEVLVFFLVLILLIILVVLWFRQS
jgi:mannosyltransferase OCH1-like enzyme